MVGLASFFLFFIGSAVTGNGCDTIIKQGIEEPFVPSSLFGVLLVTFATYFFSLYFFSHKEELAKTQKHGDTSSKVENSQKNLTFVENVTVENLSFFNLAPSPVVLKVETRLGPGIIPFPKLEIETDEGRNPDDEITKTPIGECLVEPEKIILAEVGECPCPLPSSKINERKPMVFVGGVSASTTPIELVSEFRKQGFNVTVLPRIRYGVSFGFCPDLVLSSIEEVEELLACERIYVKDRWVDIRPYIPKDCPAAATVAKEENAEEKDQIEYINAEDFATITATCTPPLGSPIHFGQPYIYPLGSPIFVPQQFYQHSPEIPFLSSHTMQTYSSQ